jgi:hypothetical protein
VRALAAWCGFSVSGRVFEKSKVNQWDTIALYTLGMDTQPFLVTE